MAMQTHPYVEMILASLNDTARRAMLEYRNVHHYEYQSEFARKYVKEGRQEVLVKQLVLKFGELPEWAVQRFRAADDTDLERWTERILTAATVDDVFAGPPPAAQSDGMAWRIYDDFVGLCMKAGRIEGLQHLLTKLLVLRFGELPEWVRSRLRLTLEPDIERWTERVLTAATLEAVFAD